MLVFSSSAPSGARLALVLLVLWTLSVLPSLWLRDLWNPDEPRYAEVAREMRVLGDYLIPHLNGEIYAEKPPLFFWLSAAGQGLGLGPAAGRVVTGLFALATLLVTWALTRLWFCKGTALRAACILATTELFGMTSRLGVLDVPLCFFTTLSVLGWFRHRQRGGPAIWLFYLGMGLAVLTKGPVGLAVPVLAAVAGRLAMGAADPPRPRHLLWGSALTLAVIGAWLLPACLHGGEEYARTILFKQNLGRMYSSWSHAKPPWYYLTRLPANFFPWICFLPFALLWAFRGGRSRRGLRAMLWWVVFGLIFFSLVSGKRERYLVPILPALSLLVAAYLEVGTDASGAPRPDRWRSRMAWAQHAVVGLAGFAVLAVVPAGPALLARQDAGVRAALSDLTLFPWLMAPVALGLICLTLAGLGLRAVRGDHLERAVRIGMLEMLLLFAALDLIAVPRIDRLKSPRPVAEKINAWLGSSDPDAVAMFPDAFSGIYNLYSGRTQMRVLHRPQAVVQFLAARERRLVLTIRRSLEHRAETTGQSLAHLLAATEPKTQLHVVGRVGHSEILFLTNFTPPR